MRANHLADCAVFDNILINMRADIHLTVQHSTFCLPIKVGEKQRKLFKNLHDTF
jgi:hypothetical protein